MICMKKNKIWRQGPLGSARAQPCLRLCSVGFIPCKSVMTVLGFTRILNGSVILCDRLWYNCYYRNESTELNSVDLFLEYAQLTL